MACPQKENGFVAVANELFEAIIRRRFTEYQRAIVDALIRVTYGRNRTSAKFSLGLIQHLTGIRDKHASQVLRTLESAQVVEQVQPRSGNTPATYRLQKDYERWRIPLRGPSGLPEEGLPGQGLRPRGSLDSATKDPLKTEDKEAAAQDSAPKESPPTDPGALDLFGQVLRRLIHVQPGGFSDEAKKRLRALLDATDRTSEVVLEAAASAVTETQNYRRRARVQNPDRFAVKELGRILSEPEPSDDATTDYPYEEFQD